MKTKKKLSRIDGMSCIVFLAVFACSGGVQTTCGTEVDADGGIVSLPCGGSGAGGNESQAGQGTINFAGATAVGGSVATGGSIATGGTTPTGATPYIVYAGPTTSLGEVSCGVWLGADPLNASDPKNQLPGYGVYSACNPTTKIVNDFWVRFAVSPAVPSGDSTYSYAYDYFNTAELTLSNLASGKTIGVGLNIPAAYAEYPGEGTIWMHFVSNQVPAFVIPANSCVQISVAATLCPRVRVIPNPGDPDRIYAPNGTVVKLRLGSYIFGNNPTGEISGSWNTNTFGGIGD